MFGGAENAAVALVMARRDSMPATAHRPKSPLGKTFSLPVGIVSELKVLKVLWEVQLYYALANSFGLKSRVQLSAVSVVHRLENRSSSFCVSGELEKGGWIFWVDGRCGAGIGVCWQIESFCLLVIRIVLCLQSVRAEVIYWARVSSCDSMDWLLKSIYTFGNL